MASSSSYEFVVNTDLDFEAAESRTRELLQGEGFGVLTEIDVRATLKAKLGVEFRPYKILGACNPQLAHHALEVEPAIGLLLPCNVVIEEIPSGQVRVRFVEPRSALSLAADPAVQPIAEDASERLHRVAERLGQGA
ncbi:MAG TPA: DUF302 domain-containing protein [Candidatus Dormibacteraeota bacterium]|jgi:uncharacterized protein (DUF302 family)